jgi:hypothetical protein
VECTGNDLVQTITARCTPPTAAFTLVKFTSFVSCSAVNDYGGAVYINYDALVVILSASFLNCQAKYGGCAYLGQLRSGTSVVDCCATRCNASFGAVWFAQFILPDRFARKDLMWKGISAFGCVCSTGGLWDESARTTASDSNLTNLGGTASNNEGPGIWDRRICSTTGSFLLFAGCRGLYSVIVRDGEEDDASNYRQCLFIGNSRGGAISQEAEGHRTVMEACYFVYTKLRGGGPWNYVWGTVLIVNCLFSGAVEVTTHYPLTGVQITFTSTRISFDTASLLPTCGGVAQPFPTTPPETPGETTPPETPEETASETPRESAASEGPAGLSGGAIAGIVVGVIVLIAVVVGVMVFVALKRPGDAGSHDLAPGGDTAEEAAASV